MVILLQIMENASDEMERRERKSKVWTSFYPVSKKI
jgi:hypothetical protein